MTDTTTATPATTTAAPVADAQQKEATTTATTTTTTATSGSEETKPTGTSSSSESSSGGATKSLHDFESIHDLLKLKQNELQDLCEEAKVESKGKKIYLVGRLIKSFPKVDEEELNKVSATDLKEFCLANGLSAKGNKKDYVAKLLAFREGKPIPEPAPTETKRRRESTSKAAAAGGDDEESSGADSSGETETKRRRTSTGGAAATTPSKKDNKPAAEDMKKLKVVIDGDEREIEPTASRTFTGWKGLFMQTIDGHKYDIDIKIHLSKSK